MAQRPIVVDPPSGLVYRPELIAVDEEWALLGILEDLRFDEIRMRGQVARRTARHYGVGYDYEERAPRPGEPLPEWLEPLRRRAGELAGVPAEDLVEALLQRYPPGATIGRHRDAPAFGRVVGLSMASSCRMRFQRGAGEARQVAELVLEPRSGYLLSGPARWAWQHSPPTRELRYSITFRTLRGRGESRSRDLD